jgi:hypothetical protein
MSAKLFFCIRLISSLWKPNLNVCLPLSQVRSAASSGCRAAAALHPDAGKAHGRWKSSADEVRVAVDVGQPGHRACAGCGRCVSWLLRQAAARLWDHARREGVEPASPVAIGRVRLPVGHVADRVVLVDAPVGVAQEDVVALGEVVVDPELKGVRVVVPLAPLLVVVADVAGNVGLDHVRLQELLHRG